MIPDRIVEFSKNVGYKLGSSLLASYVVAHPASAYAEVSNQRQQPSISMETACHLFFDDEGEEYRLITAFIEARNIPLDLDHPNRIFLIYLSEVGGVDMYVDNLGRQASYTGYIEGHVKYHKDSPLQEDVMYEASLRVQMDPDDPVIVATRHRSAKCPETPNP